MSWESHAEELPEGWPEPTFCMICGEPGTEFCDHDRQIPWNQLDQYCGGAAGCYKRKIFCQCGESFKERIKTVSIDMSALRKFHG